MYSGLFEFWVFTLWNLSPELYCRVALAEIFFRAISFCILVSFTSTADVHVINS